VSDQVSPGEATALLERANDAVNFTDSVLSFLEGASVVLGAFIALGAWMLRNSVQDQIATIRAENELTQRRLPSAKPVSASLRAKCASIWTTRWRPRSARSRMPASGRPLVPAAE